jgi:hypothetical protein
MKLMKLKSLFVLCLICQVSSAFLLAYANTITYSVAADHKPAQFDGEIPLSSIASIKLPKGLVQFKGQDVNVLAVPDWLFDRNVVLSGALIRAEFIAAQEKSPTEKSPQDNSTQDKSAMIAGLAYFLGGDWIANLASPRATDVIETLSGEQIRGRILSRTDNAFAIKPEGGATRKVEFSEIKTINSPRAFRFTIPATTTKISPEDGSITIDADKINMSPAFLHGNLICSNPEVPKSTLAGSDPGIRKTSIATFLALDIVNEIAPAIVIPLVLNPGTSEQANRQLLLWNISQERATGTPFPLIYNGQGDSRYVGPFGPAINPLKAISR